MPSNHCAGKAGLLPLHLYAHVRFVLMHIAHETAGAARTRSSLRPLLFGAERSCKPRAYAVARTMTHISSSPRTRGPIRRVVSLYAVRPMPSPTITARGYGSPRSRGRRNIGSRSRDTLRPRLTNFVGPLETRGRREDRVRAAPAVSCALMHRKMRTRAYRFGGGSPAFPAQWLYGIYRALPGESELLATIAPGRRWPLKDLTPAFRASGPHDFAVRAISLAL